MISKIWVPQKLEKSKLDLNFGDGTQASVMCDSDDDRFAIFDISELGGQLLSGINKIAFSLSDKNVTKELSNADQHSIGLKMQCFDKK